jgi:hypothetical protein
VRGASRGRFGGRSADHIAWGLTLLWSPRGRSVGHVIREPRWIESEVEDYGIRGQHDTVEEPSRLLECVDRGLTKLRPLDDLG